MVGPSGKGGLVSRQVMVPSSVWPSEKPPAGKKGWEGTVASLRTARPETYFVTFPDDPAVYWFSASDLRKWLLPEAAHSQPSKTASKPVTSPAKRKAEDTVVTSPAKKGKAIVATSKSPVAGLSKPLPPKPVLQGKAGKGEQGGGGKLEQLAAAVKDLQDVANTMTVDQVRALTAYAKRGQH